MDMKNYSYIAYIDKKFAHTYRRLTNILVGGRLYLSILYATS